MKNIIVISAPSGAGKTTLCSELQRGKPHIKFSVSCTTRPKRKHEVDGVNYYFLSDQEFTEKVQNNEFVEYENVHGYYYGTLRKTLEDALAQQKIVFGCFWGWVKSWLTSLAGIRKILKFHIFCLGELFFKLTGSLQKHCLCFEKMCWKSGLCFEKMCLVLNIFWAKQYVLGRGILIW